MLSHRSFRISVYSVGAMLLASMVWLCCGFRLPWETETQYYWRKMDFVLREQKDPRLANPFRKAILESDDAIPFLVEKVSSRDIVWARNQSAYSMLKELGQPAKSHITNSVKEDDRSAMEQLLLIYALAKSFDDWNFEKRWGELSSRSQHAPELEYLSRKMWLLRKERNTSLRSNESDTP